MTYGIDDECVGLAENWHVHEECFDTRTYRRVDGATLEVAADQMDIEDRLMDMDRRCPIVPGEGYHRDYVPQRIVKWRDGRGVWTGEWALIHGRFADSRGMGGSVLLKNSVEECMMQVIEWKNEGLCSVANVDRLFLDKRIEWK